ncbi:MAG TPA: glycosyltransferase [Pyrinomonadaceae bacterium]|nr:glycosyltransferase [Pyrinomonadaceae bacterium]
MLTGRDIIYISSIEWSFLWQPHQEIALRLARAGNRILYIENTGVRAPGLGDAGRVVARLKSWVGSLKSRGVREVAAGVYVCSPLILPPFGTGLRKFVNRHLLLPLIRRVFRKLDMRDVIIWSYLPTDTVLDLIKLLRTQRGGTIYYCMADFPKLTPDSAQIAATESVLVEQSDLVFANCTTISKRLSKRGKQVHVFPPGVDLAAFPLSFDSSDNPRGPQPVLKIETLKHPVIGYIGGLHRHVDFDMIVKMANARPDWSWVFVGPLQASTEKLEGCRNIYLEGAKPHEELAGCLQRFDVCIVPYLRSAYTETVVPVKVNEYLAAGKPVVSTDLPTVSEFNERHNILITTKNTRDDFLKGIEQALELPNDPEAIARRREVAALCDWNVQMEAMSTLIEQKLGEKT